MLGHGEPGSSREKRLAYKTCHCLNCLRWSEMKSGQSGRPTSRPDKQDRGLLGCHLQQERWHHLRRQPLQLGQWWGLDLEQPSPGLSQPCSRWDSRSSTNLSKQSMDRHQPQHLGQRLDVGQLSRGLNQPHSRRGSLSSTSRSKHIWDRPPRLWLQHKV